MGMQITLLATLVAAAMIAQTIWILRLYAQIEEMERTWRPRNNGVLSPMPWPPAGQQPASTALVGEVVTAEEVDEVLPAERQFRVDWNVEVQP